MKRNRAYPLSRLLLLLSVLAPLAFTPSAPISARQNPFIKGPVHGQVVNVLDGDTFTVRVQVWLGQEIMTNVRILGIDTPEMHSECKEERRMANDARTELAALLKEGKVELYNIRNDKYAGRVLAEAKTGNGSDISAHMIEKGLARPYAGQARKKWC